MRGSQRSALRRQGVSLDEGSNTATAPPGAATAQVLGPSSLAVSLPGSQLREMMTSASATSLDRLRAPESEPVTPRPPDSARASNEEVPPLNVATSILLPEVHEVESEPTPLVRVGEQYGSQSSVTSQGAASSTSSSGSPRKRRILPVPQGSAAGSRASSTASSPRMKARAVDEAGDSDDVGLDMSREMWSTRFRAFRGPASDDGDSIHTASRRASMFSANSQDESGGDRSHSGSLPSRRGSLEPLPESLGEAAAMVHLCEGIARDAQGDSDSDDYV